MLAIDIYTAITIPENKGIVLNCTKDRFDGKHEWSRKDGEPAVTTTRILTEDTRLNITRASVEDAGEYICRNGPTVTHRFVITVEVFVKVQMIVKVLNYEYTPELQNKSSPAYKATEKNFTAEMDKLYKNTPGYVRTEVLNFTKGSVNVDFRVIIVINATDPKNASAIPDAKAETTHQVVREAKTGFVKQLRVSPVVEVFSPPLEPRGIEIFDQKSDKLGVRWEPSEDADAFKVESYHVQYRELLTKISQSASVPSTEKKDTYSYLIKDLEPKTTYMIRVGAENRHGTNFNEEMAYETLAPPFAKWIIVLIVLGILLVIGIIVGLIVFTRRRAEQRRKKLKEEEDGRFGGLSGDVRLASVPNYETRNVKGIKFSFSNKSFMPSEANWKEIPYEKITLMNELGSGAFGVVYKGELKQDNGNVTPCAVKTLKESATTEEIRDLYNELEIMTNVGYHPNLVNLLGACTEDGHLLVVIEIAENGNLLELLRKSRETNQNYGNIQGTVLTSDSRLRIAADVAKGMAHLANGRWIHRDLAARNVLLAKNYVAKVADYGMARDIYEQLMYKKETQGKLPVKWMAIESLETYIFTTESDVWSYGVLLWEMESGGLKPYAGLSTTELIDQLKKGYRLEKPDGCSDAVYQIMRDCWNPNPKSRPTFDDLVTRLENMAVSS